jgi:hypothetical protein
MNNIIHHYVLLEEQKFAKDRVDFFREHTSKRSIEDLEKFATYLVLLSKSKVLEECHEQTRENLGLLAKTYRDAAKGIEKTFKRKTPFMPSPHRMGGKGKPPEGGQDG